MAKLTSLLNQRFVKKENPKMAALAEQSSEGQLTSFAGIFGVGKLGENEREALTQLLKKYAQEEESDITSDLNSLLAITSEVKAINNQAALLHGERIKRAQDILKKYRDGAFTAWLLTAYGNRQTPYNFLQYFEFFAQMPKTLHPQIESMPRQAVYTLASREGPLEKKEDIVRNYKGERKQHMISLIRTQFPLEENDRRRENIGENASALLQRLITVFEGQTVRLTTKQKAVLSKQIVHLKRVIESAETIS